MRAYVVKRGISLVPVMLVVGAIGFLVIHLIPGDPAAVMLGPEATPGDIENLRRQLGLDRPLIVQFVRWLWNAVRGDFGRSIFLGRPVSQAILERMEPSLLLACFAELVAIILGVPTGVLAAVHRGKVSDTILMGFSVAGLSVPSFWLALMFVLLFSVELGLLPVAGYVPLAEGAVRTLRYLILPALTLGIINAALISRMTRSGVLEVLSQDYIRTARAKGVPERWVIYRHALKNALIPIVTVIGLSFGNLFSGAVVIETVFAIPGVGQLVSGAVFRRDYPVVQGVLVFIALVYVLLNLLVDLVYVWVDPRIRY